MRRAIAFLIFAASSTGMATDAPDPGPRRTEVLFLGSENRFNHDPIARFRGIRKALGPKGINFTYSASLEVLNPSTLAARFRN